jgi:hypothetical protein
MEFIRYYVSEGKYTLVKSVISRGTNKITPKTFILPIHG